MLKQLLSAVVAVAVVSQGIAMADEPAPPGVTMVRDRAALAAHIEALEEGDHVAVATAEGVVSGELVDKDTDDVVIDQPLIQGGAERVTIPRREIQAIRYQQSSAHQTRVPVKALVTIAVIVGAALVFLRALGPMP
jgi:hypothetical protein